jgi:hypothetical protein
MTGGQVIAMAVACRGEQGVEEQLIKVEENDRITIADAPLNISGAPEQARKAQPVRETCAPRERHDTIALIGRNRRANNDVTYQRIEIGANLDAVFRIWKHDVERDALQSGDRAESFAGLGA